MFSLDFNFFFYRKQRKKIGGEDFDNLSHITHRVPTPLPPSMRSESR